MEHKDVSRRGALATNKKLSASERKANASKASKARWNKWKRFRHVPVKREQFLKLKEIADDRGENIEHVVESVFEKFLAQ